MATNSIRRNTAFDPTKPEFVTPQTRVEANRWLDKVTFGAATAVTDIEVSTKTNIVAVGGKNDEAVDLMNSTYAAFLDAGFMQEPKYSPTDGVTTVGEFSFLYGNEVFGTGSMFLGSQTAGYHRWFMNEALYGARVRAKATYALSQIIVCRQASSPPQAYTAFVDALFEATKSTNTNSYRRMLKRVTYNHAMGNWLTYHGNAKANPATGARPDENYGREIMQLFSIGLDCKNMDGTPVLDASGEVVRTYDEAYVPEAAKFFTGLRYYMVYGLPDHMVHIGSAHETAEKKGLIYPDGSQAVLPAQTPFERAFDTFSNPAGYAVTVIDANTFTVQATEPLPGGWITSTQTTGYSLTPDGPIIVGTTSNTRPAFSTTLTVTKTAHGLTNGQVIYSKHNIEASIDFFIDQLVNHPTCPVFMAERLIKLLVTNNPSPEYIKRVATVFVNNGNGVRGDLSAVFKAIFLDRECIIPYGKNPNNHGRVMTLFDRIMKLGSGLRNDTIHMSGYLSDLLWERDPIWGSPTRSVSASSQVVNRVFSEPRYKKECGSIVPDRSYIFPIPFNSPSVFNFYRPGYVPPKTQLGELGLTAPEMQITTAETQTMWSAICLAATHYGDLVQNVSENNAPAGTTTGAATDPRGGNGKTLGFNFGVGTATIEVLSVAVTTSTRITCRVYNLEAMGSETGTIGNTVVNAYHRRLGGYVRLYAFAGRPAAGGTHDVVFEVNTTANLYDRTTSIATPTANAPGLASNYQVGDILDLENLFVFGQSGFPGAGIATTWQPFITVLHKAALVLPDTLSVSDAELDAGVTYIENILATRPISPEIKTLMKQAANQPVTLPARMLPANPKHDNLYSLMIYGYAQIRMRRMLAVYLVSPEFATQY